MNLYSVALAMHSAHPGTKPLGYYQKYESFLSNHGLDSIRSILEIGTFEGESTKILAKAFPSAKILTVDSQIREINFADFPNVTVVEADQSDAGVLIPLLHREFSDKIDLVIDDASHIGAMSKKTFDIVFPMLNSKGAYFIEDWGTGYWDSWTDGRRMKSNRRFKAGVSGSRTRSHDFGMVGFVKSLVDLTHESAIRTRQDKPPRFTSRVRVLEFGEGVCMMVKA